MKAGKILVISVLITVSVFLFGGCDQGGGSTSPVTYDIGDTGPAGGLIFYIDEADEFDWTYLEVAPASTEWVDIKWGGSGTEVTGAEGTAIGTGHQNTRDIVDQYGEREPCENLSDYAARLCDNLVSGGRDDWFLPSQDELNAIWTNLVNDGTGASNGVGGFALDYYWASSEYGAGYAWIQGMDEGLQYNNYKNNYSGRVRAVRAF